MLVPGQKEQCLAPADRPSAAPAAAAAAAAEEAEEAAAEGVELTDADIAKNIAKLKSTGGSAKNGGKPGAFRKKSSGSKAEVRRPSAPPPLRPSAPPPRRAPRPLAAARWRPGSGGPGSGILGGPEPAAGWGVICR